jgi:hypothetical protein
LRKHEKAHEKLKMQEKEHFKVKKKKRLPEIEKVLKNEKVLHKQSQYLPVLN